MSEKAKNHIGEDGLYTPDGLDYIFDKGFMHNCYLDGEKYGCESEVTPFAVSIYQNKFSYLKDYWKIECYVSKDSNKLLSPRRQMSTRGSFLTKDYKINDNKSPYSNDWKSIDVVGDIITSITSNSYKSFDKEIIKNLKLRHSVLEMNKLNQSFTMFCFLAGTIGNMIIVPEGVNKKTIENLKDLKEHYKKAIDNYEDYCNNDSGYINSINNHLKNKYTFGRMTCEGDTISKHIIDKIYSFWFHNNIKIQKNSIDFIIQDNYFSDAYDETKQNIKQYLLNPKQNDENQWSKWYIANSKHIVERGYRIWYSDKGENGITFNDQRPFSEIEMFIEGLDAEQRKDENNKKTQESLGHILRVKQVIYCVKKLVEEPNSEYNKEKFFEKIKKDFNEWAEKWIENPKEDEYNLKLV